MLKTLHSICFLLCISNFLFSQESNHIQIVKNYEMAHNIQPGRMEISIDGIIMNDDVDIFDFKTDIITGGDFDISSFSEFGDMEGFHITSNLGINRKLAARFNFGMDWIEMGLGKTEIMNIGMQLKYVLLEETNIIPTISISLGLDTHISNNIKGNVNALSFDLGEIEINQTFDPAETLTIGGLNDRSVKFGLHMGKIYNGKWMTYSFFKYDYTRVDSEFDTSLAIAQLQKLEDNFKYTSHSYTFGFGTVWQMSNSFAIFGEFKNIYFDRDFEGGSFTGEDEKLAHILDAGFHYFPSETIGLTLGGLINSSVLAGTIPLTYNKSSASKFDNPYGFLYFSVNIGFNIGHY